MHEICQGIKFFKCIYLGDYFELEGLPHHSSEVFFHGESISDRFSSVLALYVSISRVEVSENSKGSPEEEQVALGSRRGVL